MITVNGEQIAFEGSIADLVALRLGSRTSGVAVALNGEVVARGGWPVQQAAAGDRVEIVTAVQGG